MVLSASVAKALSPGGARCGSIHCPFNSIFNFFIKNEKIKYYVVAEKKGKP